MKVNPKLPQIWFKQMHVFGDQSDFILILYPNGYAEVYCSWEVDPWKHVNTKHMEADLQSLGYQFVSNIG